MRVKLLFVSNCFFGSTFDDPWLKKFLAYKFNPKHTKGGTGRFNILWRWGY